MRVLFKYISKLFFGPFLIGLGGFIVFVSVELLYQLSNVIVRNRVGIEKLFVLIYYHLPSFTADGIPVGVLLAIFWTVSTLSQRRELMAMQVHGISLKNLFFPFLVISLTLSGVVYLLNDFIVPDYYVKAERYMSEAIFKRPKVEKYIVSESVIRYKDMFIYVREYDKKREIMKGVMIIDYSGSEEKVMTAEEVYREGNSWYLVNGRLYVVGEDGKMRLDSVYKKLKLDFEEDIGMLLAYPSERKMSHSDLVRAINATRDRKRAAKWIVELHRRYATAFAPVIIVLAGLSLSLLFNLTSKSWGVILTFVLVVLYQGSGAWLSAMGREMMIDPILAVWLPDILFGGIGLTLLALVDTTAVQKIREILMRIGIFAVLLLPFSGFSYTISADKMTIHASGITFDGKVEIYEDGKIIAEASKAFYSLEGEYLVLLNAFSSDERAAMTSSNAIIIDGKSFYRDVKGKMDIKGGIIDVVSGAIAVKVGNVRVLKDARIHVEKQEGSSDISAVFLITDASEVKDGMGISEGIFKDKRFLVRVVKMDSEDVFEGITGFMDTKVGKKKKRFYFAGNWLIVLEDKLELRGAYITTCSENPPHYTIAFEKAFAEEDYLVSRNVVFFLGDIPLFYFPYFFQFFVEPPPLSLSLGFGKKDSKTVFKFNSKFSDLALSYAFSGGTDEFGVSGKVFVYPFNISWKGGKTGITLSKLPFNSKLLLSSSPRSVIYQYSLSTKVSKARLKLLLKRQYLNGRTSWIIPNLSMSKLGFAILGGKFLLKNLSFRGDVSYSEGDIFENFESSVYKSKFSMSFSRQLIGFSGTSFSAVTSGSLEATPSGFQDYSVDSKINLKLFSKKITYSWLEISGSQSYGLSTKIVKSEDPTKIFNESSNYSVNVNLFSHLKIGLGYVRGARYSEGNVIGVENKLSASGLFSWSAFSLSAKSEYNFLLDEPKWSYPDIEFKTSFEIFYVSNVIVAKTRYEYDSDEPFKSVSVSYSQSYGKRIKNSLSFVYDLTSDVPVRLITDKFSLKSFKIGGLILPNANGMFKYELSNDESKLTYFYIKFSQVLASYKMSASYKYSSRLGEEGYTGTLNYSISSSKSDPSVRFVIGASMNESELRSFKISLNLKKKLHCWDMNLNLSGRLANGVFSLDKLFLGFVISDLPDKRFDYNLMNGEFEFNAM